LLILYVKQCSGACPPGALAKGDNHSATRPTNLYISIFRVKIKHLSWLSTSVTKCCYFSVCLQSTQMVFYSQVFHADDGSCTQPTIRSKRC